jgi:hypothetical protein
MRKLNVHNAAMASLPEASLAVLYLTLPYSVCPVTSLTSHMPLRTKHREGKDGKKERKKERKEGRKDVGRSHNRPEEKVLVPH